MSPDQPSLFDEPDEEPEREPVPRARSSDPWTSHAAIGDAHARTAEDAVAAVFVNGTRLIDDELVRRLPELYGPTVRSARSRLSRRGDLIDTGELRLTNRGRAAIVWTRSNG